MKNIIVALFAASSLFVAAPLPVFAANVAAVCDGSVPEAWQRPGGFCDQNDFNHSLTGPSDSVSCERIQNIAMNGRDEDIRTLVAVMDPCCAVPTNFKFNPSTGKVIVADVPCCNVGFMLDQDTLEQFQTERDRVVLVGC